MGRDFAINVEFSSEDIPDVFEKIDKKLLEFAFESGSFGTIAHACVASILNGEKTGIPVSLDGLFAPDDGELLLAAGTELAQCFVDSPLGKIARHAELRENEYNFRSLISDHMGNEIFVSGAIDLLFEDEKTVHVVDFKTDSRESPGDYTGQMSYYYQAVSALFAAPLKKECRTWLYYLRTGHAVEMTDKAKQIISRT